MFARMSAHHLVMMLIPQITRLLMETRGDVSQFITIWERKSKGGSHVPQRNREGG